MWPWIENRAAITCIPRNTSCICHENEFADGDGVEGSRCAAEPIAALPVGPVSHAVPTFSTNGPSHMFGEPLVRGEILLISVGRSIQEMRLVLHRKGFLLVHATDSPEGEDVAVARMWSPFSLVEKCQVKASPTPDQWSIFKLTIFRSEDPDLSFYFACSGSECHSQREAWVHAIASVIGDVTVSLFPAHQIQVHPLPGKQRTSMRLIAGYLLHCARNDTAELLYCELHAHFGGESQLVCYTNEWCEREVFSIVFTDQAVVSTRKGSYCTVFGIDAHRLSARTRDEKELWLRAVSNVKVKLMFSAPDPDPDDLAIYRGAVSERVEALQPLEPSAMSDRNANCDEHQGALLREMPRAPPLGPAGDVWTSPDPADLEHDDASTTTEIVNETGAKINDQFFDSAGALCELAEDSPRAVKSGEHEITFPSAPVSQTSCKTGTNCSQTCVVSPGLLRAI